MNNKLKFVILGISVILLSISTSVYPQFYFGAGIGSSFVNKELIDLSGDDFRIDANSFGYKIFSIKIIPHG